MEYIYHKAVGPVAKHQSLSPNELWTVQREGGHWYDASADFALETLGEGAGKCLVIGSPLFEVEELRGAGWNVTYLDVREPPTGSTEGYTKGDACAMPFADAEMDAVSSSCVLCHAGLGRYGDEERNFGDMLMLKEIARVLKRGAMSVLSVPACTEPGVHVVGTIHRVYSLDALRFMAKRVGMLLESYRCFSVSLGRWLLDEEQMTDLLLAPDYLSVVLRREARI
jgi:SAM-dependent methyltransferase